MRKLILFAAVAASALASSALAQQTYPTAASGVRVQGTVPLQCNASGASCAPITWTNPQTMILTNGGGANVQTGSANVDTTNPNNINLEVMSRGYIYDPAGGNWVRQRGDNNGTVVTPALTINYWNYAAASGGIVNTTTAVTIKASAGASLRNYLCTLNVGHDTLGAATELAVRDGAAGPVLFRMKLQTAANEGNSEITFAPCLKGSVNTLMEVVTLTATVSGGTYVNASGYIGN